MYSLQLNFKTFYLKWIVTQFNFFSSNEIDCNYPLIRYSSTGNICVNKLHKEQVPVKRILPLSSAARTGTEVIAALFINKYITKKYAHLRGFNELKYAHNIQDKSIPWHEIFVIWMLILFHTNPNSWVEKVWYFSQKFAAKIKFKGSPLVYWNIG